MSHSPYNNTPFSSTHPLKIQHIVRLKRFAKFWRIRIQKRLAKNRSYRLNVINEWIQTQTNYVRDLNIIIHNMKTPMKQKAILTPQQLKIVFANIQAILLLSERLLQQLLKIRENWEPDTIMISSKLNKFYPYLKIYSEYYNNYHIAHNIITEIRHLEDVQEISKALAMDFESYLIKPIQGPLKYELLMKEYWGRMPRRHPDYNGIRDTIQKYTKVNTSNNDQLGQKEKIAKIIRLGKVYSELVKPGRELIKEFVASTFYISIVKVYLLTDLLLITRDQNGKEVFEKVIEFDGKKSFVDYKNGKHCNDLTIIVCGVRESIHLRFMSRNLMDIACREINHVIASLLDKQRAKQNILSKKYSMKQQFKTTAMSLETRDSNHIPMARVVCVGVYKRSVSMLKNRTYYILKLSFNSNVEFSQQIFIRFSQVQKLRKQLCTKYKTVVFPTLSLNLATYKQISVTDIPLDPANIVAYRTFCIPQFLNFVFRCDKVMADPLPMLNVLGIQQNFWEYLFEKESEECRCILCRKQQKSMDVKGLLQQRESYMKKCEEMGKEEFCMMRHLRDRAHLLSISTKEFVTLEEQLMYLQYKQGRINYNMIYRRNKAKIQFNIRVSLMSLEHENVEIKINEGSTVGEVLDAICRYFRMYNYRDFGLFIQDETDMRLLDEDELIYQILKQSEETIEPVEEKGFCLNLKNLTKWSKKICKPKSSKLYFGKYLFLGLEVERSACQRSTIRYRFVIEQIFYYVHKRLIVLSESEMKRIVALYLCLRLQEQIQRLTKENIPLEKIYNFVPSDQVTPKWILEVINIVTAERNLIEGSNFFMLIYDRILQIVQNKPGWKSMLFSVTQTNGSKPIYLGINIDGLLVLQKDSNTSLLNIPINLLKFRMSPFSITIQFNELECKFEGNSIFNFSKMAQKYYLLKQLFGNKSQKLQLQSGEEQLF